MDHYGFGTGDEMRSQDESRTQGGGKERKKRGDQTSFLPTQVTSQGGFIPSFGFALPVPLLLLIFLLKIKALSE
jgi:hypothetical protein